MTLKEENEALRAKLEKYEELILQMMEGPYLSGTVTSKTALGMFRVATDEGKEVLISPHPEIVKKDLKEGVRVIINDKMITNLLPNELEKTPEEVQFDFTSWSQIAGIKSQVEKIKEAVNAPILYGKRYKEYGLTPCKGILLYGPPGCGKTLVAKAIASTFLQEKNVTKDSFIYMKGGEMLSPYVGVAENNIKSAFVRAKQNFKKNGNRSVIFIDEAEALLPARGSRRSSDVETTIVPTFLSEMDGFEANSTFIILATNYPDSLDPAVIRPGRIDLKIEIGRPNEDDAIDIFGLYLSKTKCESSSLAKEATKALFDSTAAKQVSGALIKNIVDKASLIALKRDTNDKNNGITKEDIEIAIREL